MSAWNPKAKPNGRGIVYLVATSTAEPPTYFVCEVHTLEPRDDGVLAICASEQFPDTAQADAEAERLTKRAMN